jgi:phosphopantetheine--protein transferase-like protein
MANREQLKAVVSELYKAPLDQIGPDFSLRHPRFQSSAGRGVLAAAIRRRLGVYAPAAFAAATYGELEAAVCNGGVADSAPAPARQAPPADGPAAAPASAPGIVPPPIATPLSVGVDVEMIDSLPEAQDFWASDYYRSHFSAEEIAYCIRQEHPRMHFAARWCAKEALMKCDSRFAAVDPATLQVVIDASGRPALEWLQGEQRQRLPHAVSLTHTPLLAAAVVASAGQ